MGTLDRLSRFAYRSRYRNAVTIPTKTPVDVSLELASACNQRCSYCYHADAEHLPFTKGVMDLKTGIKIIEQSAEIGVPSIKFNWKGESTLNPHFEALTALAKSYAGMWTFQDRLTNSNFKFSTTNESIFNGLCNQTKVKVSFDSFNADVMHAQRAGSNHALAKKNITKFYNHPARKNTEIVIQAVRTTLNKDEDIAGEAKKLWPEASVSIRDMVSGRVESAAADSLVARERDASERQSCLQAHARIIFNWEGKAFPCCPDIAETLLLGSIETQTVKEIFNSLTAKRLRKALKDKSIFNCASTCAKCSSFETYKGFKPSWES